MISYENDVTHILNDPLSCIIYEVMIILSPSLFLKFDIIVNAINNILSLLYSCVKFTHSLNQITQENAQIKKEKICITVSNTTESLKFD